MDNSRELASLLRRANRVAIVQSPPALTMTVLPFGEELPPPSPGPSRWRSNQNEAELA
mgnify:CR=1 FL=1